MCMTSLAARFFELRPLIDQQTQEDLSALLVQIGSGEASSDFLDSAFGAIRSGKRFRAFLAHFGAALVSGKELGQAPVAHLGAALELYQASALAHDDVIDHADTRRGAPTPHIRLATIHRERQWLGSDEQFGAAAAILLGDLLFSAAERSIGLQCESLEPKIASRLLARYTTMHAEVALGQYLDVRAEHLPLDLHNPDAIPLREVREVVIRKSAHYSIVHPALLGAIAAGGSEELVQALEEALTPWGIAFQLRDDDLGVFGDPEVTGKPAGDDLREGKRTMLLSLSWKNASVAEREILAGVLGDEKASPDNIARATEVIATRGRDVHEALIASLVDEGEAQLEDRFSEAERADLLELAQIITARLA
ncbi:polyprenyl synthetase family protein [Schaalia cardiffensis]